VRQGRGRVGARPAPAATIRLRTPSLTVVPGRSTYQLISDRRLRIGGDEPAGTYELDRTGLVVAQPGRSRLALAAGDLTGRRR
jgi:hypothetical protein